MRESSVARGALGLVSLGAIAALLVFANLGGYRPLTTHEVLVARTAREMWQRGEWVLPTLLGEPRWRKPPLAYWETILAYQLCGEANEWSARLPSALAGIGLVFVTYWLAAGALGRSVAWLAGFLVATSAFFLTQARLAEVDITLCALVAGALAAFSRIAIHLLTGRERPLRGLVASFWVCCGLAALAKGPVGPLFIAGTVALFRLLGPDHGAIRALWSPSIIAACLLAVALWPVAVVLVDSSAASVWWAETWDRFIADPNGVRRYPFYYVIAALALTLPWTPLWLIFPWTTRRRWLGCLARVVRITPPRTRPGTTARILDRLLAAWLLAPLSLLSLAGGKQQHYLMPALVPCAVWAARMGAILGRQWTGWWRRTLRDYQGGFPIRLLLHPRALRAAWIAAILAVQVLLLPKIHGRRATADWMRAIQASVPAEQPILVLGHSVRWLGFYFDREGSDIPTLEAYFARPVADKEWILTTRRELAAIQSRRAIARVLESPRDRSTDENRRALLVEARPLAQGPAGPRHAN